MPETPVSLFEHLRLQRDAESWQRLVDLYTPLIRDWLRRQELPASEADDMPQEVLAVVVRELPGFRHDLRVGAFRRWLKNITINRLRTFWRARKRVSVAGGEGKFAALLAQLDDPSSSLSRQWDEEHDRHMARRLLELIEPEFEPTAQVPACVPAACSSAGPPWPRSRTP